MSKAALSRSPAAATAQVYSSSSGGRGWGQGRCLRVLSSRLALLLRKACPSAGRAATLVPPALRGAKVRHQGCAAPPRRTCRDMLQASQGLAPSALLGPGGGYQWDKTGPWTPLLPNQVSPSLRPAKAAGTSTCPANRKPEGGQHTQPQSSPRHQWGRPSQGSQARGRHQTKRALARRQDHRVAGEGSLGPCP